jgi:hypothetical protein
MSSTAEKYYERGKQFNGVPMYGGVQPGVDALLESTRKERGEYFELTRSRMTVLVFADGSRLGFGEQPVTDLNACPTFHFFMPTAEELDKLVETEVMLQRTAGNSN